MITRRNSISEKLVIVTPIYEDTKSAKKLLNELKNLFQENIFIVAVDDGSIQEPFRIEILNRLSIEGVVVKLVKNVGHQKAIAIGLQYVADKLDWVKKIVVMDSDGEDDPETVPILLEILEKDDIDVAVGKRKNRSENRMFKIFYGIYQIIFKILTGRSFGFGNFISFKAGALKRIVAMPEIWTHLAACVLSSKLRMKESWK